MIKYLKYIAIAAISLMAVTGCQDEPEDSFSTAPVAPSLQNNGSILMTQNTMDEPIRWAWTAARFLKGDVTYSLFVRYEEEEPVQVGQSTTALTLTMGKTEFRTLLEGITAIPENSTFDLNFYVEAADTEAVYKSAELMMTVYSYGNFISAVATPAESEVTLDINNLTEELTLLTWEPARLNYNEAITYDVLISCGGGEPLVAATGLTETSCTFTVDTWNELFVSAGAVEGAASEVTFTVKAYSPSCEEGLPSSPVTMTVTTYKANFPYYVYLKGTDKQIPQSWSQKGLFECFINFTGAATFTFEDRDAQVEYGGDAQFADDANGNLVASGALTESGSAISVKTGLYRVSANLKFKTFILVKIESMGMIGNATPGGWDAETPMTYDVASNTFTLKTTLTEGGEYKYRANNNWGYAIDGEGSFSDGTPNIVFDKATGEYNVTLDVSKHPYMAKIVSAAFPTEEFIYVPGNHQAWDPATAPALRSLEMNGIYTGFSRLDGEFKFTLARNWEDGEYNSTHFTDYSEGLAPASGSTNINMANPGFYYIEADVMTQSLKATLIESWGLIGAATPGGWDSETAMTYDAEKGCWSCTVALTAGEMKFRANGTWDSGVDLGGSLDDLVFKGSNIAVAEAGTYLVEMYLQRTGSAQMYCTLTAQ
ncbi:SusF/SusE family outer membrane protein [Barnesiella viscericola]|uniref:SusF/SusE family outer membrane protein n=1 Tax=Barnesiella viscericola TaxID=397865 RepID=A0A921MSR6_9BACT|nr:SusF/SusE family outer membrane protein [Barnesiella viscericola]HJG89477.1 SusF/SusE family outer membrane protein [Barnesiella viscericola]